MTVFPFAQAGVVAEEATPTWTGWRALAEQCLEQLNQPMQGTGLIYVTDPLGEDIAEIVEFMRQKTGIEN